VSALKQMLQVCSLEAEGMGVGWGGLLMSWDM
jgi:hypothetical protein